MENYNYLTLFHVILFVIGLMILAASTGKKEK